MAKVTISINDDLLAQVDETADEVYQTRSGLISSALTQYLMSFQLQKALGSLAVAFSKLDLSEGVDDETVRQIDDFERLVKAMQIQRL